MDAAQPTKRNPRFDAGAVTFGNVPYVNTAVLIDYLAKRIRVVFPQGASRGEIEGQLRRWSGLDDLNANFLPWDIPALAESVGLVAERVDGPRADSQKQEQA